MKKFDLDKINIFNDKQSTLFDEIDRQNNMDLIISTGNNRNSNNNPDSVNNKNQIKIDNIEITDEHTLFQNEVIYDEFDEIINHNRQYTMDTDVSNDTFLDAHELLFDNAMSNENKTENIVKSDIVISNVFDSIEDIAGCLKNLQSELKNIHKKFGALKKDYTKVITIKNKLEAKKNKQKLNLQSGFTKPRLISDEMCELLQLPSGTMIGRNSTIKLINEYIVLNNLRDEQDRRIILPDEKLRKILGITADDQTVVSYFNIQHYLKRHFL